MNMKNNGKVAELRDRLQEAMKDRGLRPIDLSNMTDVPKSMISYYLTGRNVPKADRVYKFAQVLEVNEAWLMGFDVPKVRTAEQKKNDDLVKVIAQLRKDPEFFEIVSMFAELPASEYASVKGIISALGKK